jgi:hypothetical protein
MLTVAGVLAFRLPAQDTRGEILGRVTDASGAVVSGARIRAVDHASNVVAAAVANASGDYLLPSLNPGVYEVLVEMPGFRRFRQDQVTVRSSESATVNVKLEVGPASERIQVVAQAPLLGIAAFEMAVTSERLLDLPLRDGNPVMLALLAPGVVNVSDGGTYRPYDNENASAIAVNGSSAGTHEFQIDGAANTGGASGNVAYVPPADVVSEFMIEAITFDARNGFSSGATVKLGLRQGTKHLHGQLYSYLENPAANANSFFSNKSGSGKDDFRENRWGLNANGPVEIPGLYNGHNRTFWMYGYEGISASQPYRSYNLTYTVPTPPERQGNFSDLLAFGSSYQIYDPKTTRAASTAGRYMRDPFPGNIIPASRLDAAAQNLISRYYPLPNLPGAAPTGVNYTMPSIVANQFQNHTVRVDHAIGARQKLSVRATASDRAQDLELRFNGGAGAVGERQNRGFGIDDLIVLNARFLLDVRYNYTRYVDNYGPPSAGLDLASLGFSQTFVNQIRGVDPRNLMLPDITPAGYPELNSQVATRSASDIHAAAFDFTRSAHNHNMHFGGEYRIYRDASGNTGRSSGKLNFNTNWTCGPLDNAAAAPVGQGLASFLLGLPTDGSMDVNPSLAQQYQVSGWYFQDTWKLGPRLTLNLGVRWEYEVPVTERYDRSVRGFDFSSLSPIASAAQAAYAKSPVAQIPAASFQVRGGLTFAGVDGQPRTVWNSDPHNFAPRAGLAWAPNKKTVVRAGYGMFYDIARQNAIQTGFSRTTSLVASQDTGRTYIDSLENPFPGGFVLPTGSSLGLMTNVGQGLSVFPNQLLNPYVGRWEFSLQRSLGSGAVLGIGYVGNRGTHLRVARQLDPIPAQDLSTLATRDNTRYTQLTSYVANPFYPLLPNTSLSGSTVQLLQLLRPYPQFTGIATITNNGFSWYHSLQASLQKRFAKNYLLMTTYTWSKYMEATSYLNDTDPWPTRVVSSQDRPHRVVASFVYELPIARRNRWIGGWQAQGIYQWQSGAPLSFGDVLYYGGDIHSIALPADQRNATHWFNTAAFERNSALQLAYNIRTFPLRFSGIRSMGMDMWDLGATKSVRLTDRFTLQIRADAFNAMNHTHFGAPNTSPTSSDFGSITSTSQLPRIIEFSLRVQF